MRFFGLSRLEPDSTGHSAAGGDGGEEADDPASGHRVRQSQIPARWAC